MASYQQTNTYKRSFVQHTTIRNTPKGTRAHNTASRANANRHWASRDRVNIIITATELCAPEVILFRPPPVHCVRLTFVLPPHSPVNRFVFNCSFDIRIFNADDFFFFFNVNIYYQFYYWHDCATIFLLDRQLDFNTSITRDCLCPSYYLLYSIYYTLWSVPNRGLT